MKYNLVNLAYGEVYSNLFLNFNLKSFLDVTNAKFLNDNTDFKYTIYTDEESLPKIERHPRFVALRDVVKTEIKLLNWPEEKVDRYGLRYSAQVGTFRDSAKIALQEGAWLSYHSADTLYAKSAFDKAIDTIKNSECDAILSIPMRTAAESILPEVERLKELGAISREDMFKLAYAHMGPLWVHSHWNNPLFTKLPFTMLWNSGSGLIARSLSISVMLVKPTQAMIDSENVPDTEIPTLCKNPVYMQNWDDFPVINVEPLFCYYPPYLNRRSDVREVATWARQLSKKMKDALEHKFYFPNKDTANFSIKELKDIDSIVGGIRNAI